jgi:hypothetical protein
VVFLGVAAELGGGLPGKAGEGAVELGEGLEADFVGDFGDAGVWSEEHFLGEFDAGAVDVFCEGNAGDLFKDPGEMVFAQAGVAGDEGEGDGFLEVFLDEFFGAGDGGRIVFFGLEDEVVEGAGELRAEGDEHGGDGGVSLLIDDGGGEPGGAQFVDFFFGVAFGFEGFGDGFELSFGGFTDEDFAGFEVGDKRFSRADGDGGFLHAGEALEVVNFAVEVVAEFLGGFDAGFAVGMVVVDGLAEAIFVFAGATDLGIGVGGELELEGEAGGFEVGLAVALEEFAVLETLEERAEAGEILLFGIGHRVEWEARGGVRWRNRKGF